MDPLDDYPGYNRRHEYPKPRPATPPKPFWAQGMHLQQTMEESERAREFQDYKNRASGALKQVVEEKTALKEENKEMLRCDSLETEELLKKIGLLNEHIGRLVDAEEEKRRANEQLVAQNISLKARISELEVINDEIQGRTPTRGQEKQNALNEKGTSQDLEKTQRIFRDIDTVIVAVTNGDLSQKLAIQSGENFDTATLKSSINTLVDRLNFVSRQVSVITREMGREGRLGGQAVILNASGLWKEMIENVNQLASTMTQQVRGMTSSIQSIKRGEFSQKMTEEFRGESQLLKETINHTIDTLGAMVTDINQICYETLYKDKIEGQVRNRDLEGKWGEMIARINLMASDFEGQSRDVLHVASCVISGEVSSLDIYLPPLAAPNTSITWEKLKEMVDDLKSNWTRRTVEAGKEDPGLTPQQEKLQRIWTILQSNI